MATQSVQIAELREARSGKEEKGDADKRERFIAVAERRTANALKAIRVLGNLANRAHYQYDERDVKKIISALTDEVDVLKQRLATSDRQRKIDFKL